MSMIVELCSMPSYCSVKCVHVVTGAVILQGAACMRAELILTHS